MAEIKHELEEYWTKVSQYRLNGCKKALQWLIGMMHLTNPPLLTKALELFKREQKNG